MALVKWNHGYDFICQKKKDKILSNWLSSNYTHSLSETTLLLVDKGIFEIVQWLLSFFSYTASPINHQILAINVLCLATSRIKFLLKAIQITKFKDRGMCVSVKLVKKYTVVNSSGTSGLPSNLGPTL